MIRAAVVTVSDRSARGEREDLSGPETVRVVAALPADVVATEIVPDDPDEIAVTLGLTGGRVGQLHERALLQLRARLRAVLA